MNYTEGNYYALGKIIDDSVELITPGWVLLPNIRDISFVYDHGEERIIHSITFSNKTNIYAIIKCDEGFFL